MAEVDHRMVLVRRISLPCSRRSPQRRVPRRYVPRCKGLQARHDQLMLIWRSSGGWVTASVDLTQQCVRALLGLLQGNVDRLLPDESRGHFLADDPLDRTLPLDIARERPAHLRQRCDIRAMRKGGEARILEHLLERRQMASSRPVVIVVGHEAEETSDGVLLL